MEVIERAQHYALLSNLLASPPQQSLLTDIAQVEIVDTDSPIGQGWLALINAAIQTDEQTIFDEYQSLFIGITEGEIIPYSSYYQTGFLHEKPLAALRTDLGLLGLEKQNEVSEPEDHIAAELDVMNLILSAQGTPVVDAASFYQKHILPWGEKFFKDLYNTPSAHFYKGVATLGQQFLAQETLLFK